MNEKKIKITKQSKTKKFSKKIKKKEIRREEREWENIDREKKRKEN